MLGCNTELVKLPDLANLTSDSAHSTELIGIDEREHSVKMSEDAQQIVEDIDRDTQALLEALQSTTVLCRSISGF